MNLSWIDITAFALFVLGVVAVSLIASRKEKDSEEYFLAGRSLSWWLIGFSLIASNISTEHFVGMAGQGFGAVGLAVASYEWYAAVVLVLVALVFLPRFLKLGIYTMPEFLEVRYGKMPRTIMAVFMMIAYVVVALVTVLYSGALGLQTIFGMDLVQGIWLIGLLAATYTIYGGLKAVVWSDLLQGAALLLGGAMVLVLGLREVGGLGAFLAHNGEKLHMILPADHPDIPWTALLFGMFIPHFFYWGFNQFITQRTLGAKSLAEGQKGILFAAGLKLILPILIIFPGIIAWQLYREQIAVDDQAYVVLVKNLLPAGLRGLFFAALFGAVMSSLDSMLNSASTIFTMDIYKRLLKPQADTKSLMRVGRWSTAALAVFGCLLAPLPAHFSGVYTYVQMIWGFISPGIVAVFVFGLLVRRAPAAAANTAMLMGIPLYGLLLWKLPQVAFLNHMGITFVVIVLLMALITWWKPLAKPFAFPDKPATNLDLRPDANIRWYGLAIVLAVVGLYIFFW